MRKRKTAQDRKIDIEKAALDLAFDFGPDRVTTNMIADRLGLTQPAIYKHFASKDDIWRSVATTLHEKIKRNIESATQVDASPVGRVRLLVLGHLRLVQETPALPEIMTRRSTADTESAIKSQMFQGMIVFQQTLTSMIDAGQINGTIRSDIDARDLTALVMGVTQSLILRMLISRNPDILLKDGERLLELQLSTFTRQGKDT